MDSATAANSSWNLQPAGHADSGVGAASQLNPDEWVDEYGDYLYRYALSRLRSPAAAEEAVQESFLAAIRYRHQYSGAGAERAWLLGILKRKIIDSFRKRRRDERAVAYEDESDPTAQLFDQAGQWSNHVPWAELPEARLQSSELVGVVEDCLTHLPQGQADVFVLSVMEEMDSEDICRELDITPSNYWVRMHRARLGLAKCVSSKWQLDERGADVE